MDMRRRRGAGFIEYGMMLGLVAAISVGAMISSGQKITEIFGGSANVVSLGSQGLLPSGGISLSGGVAANLPPVISTPAGQVASVRPGTAAGNIATLVASDPRDRPWVLTR